MPYATEIDNDIILSGGCALDLVYTDLATDILTSIPTTIWFAKSTYNDQYLQRNTSRSNQLLQELFRSNQLSLAELRGDVEAREFYQRTKNNRFPRQRPSVLLQIFSQYRDWIVVCNDAHTMFQLDQQERPGKYLSTVDLIKYWFDTSEVDTQKQIDVLNALSLIKYAPPAATS